MTNYLKNRSSPFWYLNSTSLTNLAYFWDMDGEQLKTLIKTHDLTYEGFVTELNTFCGRDVISARGGKNIVANWTGKKRNISPPLQFIIELFFRQKA